MIILLDLNTSQYLLQIICEKQRDNDIPDWSYFGLKVLKVRIEDLTSKLEVIDKRKFFLAVIEHGIEFRKI